MQNLSCRNVLNVKFPKIVAVKFAFYTHLMAKWKKRKETDDNTIILCIIVAKLCALWVV